MKHTRSADGTRLAYRRVGHGPSLLVIGGALADHGVYEDLADALATECDVVLWDRRGRGDSTDTPPYDVQREVDDVAAIIAALDASVSVYGHSSGAALALRAAARGLPISRLVLGDPPYSARGEHEERARAEHVTQNAEIRACLAHGDAAGAVRLFLGGFGLSKEELDAMLNSPVSEHMCRLAATLPYDYALLGDGLVPTALAAKVHVPTLVLTGGEEQLATTQIVQAMPHARLDVVSAPLHALEASHYAPRIAQFLRE